MDENNESQQTTSVDATQIYTPGSDGTTCNYAVKESTLFEKIEQLSLKEISTK